MDRLVFEKIFAKLSATFLEYREIIPAVAELEDALVNTEKENSLEIAVHILDTLKSHAAKSAIANQILNNISQDYWHALRPNEVKPYPGETYLSFNMRNPRANP